jgi:hypothetical protein
MNTANQTNQAIIVLLAYMVSLRLSTIEDGRNNSAPTVLLVTTQKSLFTTLDMGEDVDIRGRLARYSLLCIPLQDARLSGLMASVIHAVVDARQAQLRHPSALPFVKNGIV